MTLDSSPGLTPEQRQHFIEHGWIRISKAISPEVLESFNANVWVRLGYDKDDKSTWQREMIHMPRHREVLWKDYSPQLWSAICELVGGEDRIDSTLFHKAGDGLIVNLGSEKWEDEKTTINPRDLDNWHTDGDWFRKFLDSGEQGLVTLHLFTDVVHRGGPTYICEDGLKHMIEWMYDRPHGVEKMEDPDGRKAVDAIKDCSKFVEVSDESRNKCHVKISLTWEGQLTGEAGDVFLCHPLMPHSASKNHLRRLRIITNPPVTLREPLNFNRQDLKEYSLVEQKTLLELGVSSLPNWKITGQRQRFQPRTRAGKNARILEELERMKSYAARTGETVDSMYMNGIAKYSGDL